MQFRLLTFFKPPILFLMLLDRPSIGRNIIISCVYRPPGTSLTTFNEKIADLLNNMITDKVQIVCGDFNIDLLNQRVFKGISEFINIMYSNHLCPLIDKPSRITTETATLIDHIFTNRIEDKVVGGLFIRDVSDHLPVFAIFPNLFTQKK